MHPLAPDLSKLNDEEHKAKRVEIQNRLISAYRMGYGDAIRQLQLLLEDYNSEVQVRNQKLLNTARQSGRLGTTDNDSSAKDLTR